MKIIVDMDNADYYEARAIEFIQEAIEVAKAGLCPINQSTLIDGAFRLEANAETYHDCLKRAIGLLVLARVKRGYTVDKEKSR